MDVHQQQIHGKHPTAWPDDELGELFSMLPLLDAFHRN
jgi:hypothetical protein